MPSLQVQVEPIRAHRLLAAVPFLFRTAGVMLAGPTQQLLPVPAPASSLLASPCYDETALGDSTASSLHQPEGQ